MWRLPKKKRKLGGRGVHLNSVISTLLFLVSNLLELIPTVLESFCLTSSIPVFVFLPNNITPWPDESRLAIVIDEDTDSEASSNMADNSLPAPSSPSVSTTSSSMAAAASTPVVSSKHTSSTHLTNHNHNAIRSKDVTTNGDADSADSWSTLPFGESRGQLRPGDDSNSNNVVRNNSNSSNKTMEVWNFNCQLRVKVCKEVKKPGRGESLCFSLYSL